MRDLIGVGLALFLGVIGIFFAYGVFGASNSSSQIQETFLELQQARTELQSYAIQNGGYGTASFPFAQIKALALLPFQALTGTATINQWKGTIALTGNSANFFADYTNIDPTSCARLMVKTPASSGVTGIAVATSAAGLTAATVNPLPVGAATAAAACTGTFGHVMPNLPSPMALDWAYEEVRWWNHWLKGVDTGIMNEPMLRVFMPYRTQSEDPSEVPGRWVAEDTWPSRHITAKTFHLNDGGVLGAKAGATKDVKYVADKPVGIAKSHWMPSKIVEESPDDKNALVFDSAVLTDDMEILGYPTAKIRVSADAPVAKLALRLNEVLPDGQSWLVTYGILNLPHRDSLEHPTPLKPGEFYDVELPIYPVAHRFKKGSRIRAAISESLWPLVWPSPSVVTLNVTQGVSSLTLPVRPMPLKEAAFTIPIIHTPGQDQPVLKQTGPDDDGKITLSRETPAAEAPPIPDTGTIMTNGGGEYYEIKEGDPNTNLWRQHNIAGFKRGDWDCTVIVGFEMTSTADEFHLKEYVRANRGGKQIFDREKISKINRMLI